MSKSAMVRRRNALSYSALLGLSLVGLVPAGDARAQVLPGAAAVRSGDVSISTSAARMDIRQATEKGIIDWDSFSIGNGAVVAIDNGAGATLNRVTGATVSSIDGLLQATGSVFLLNGNGIIVGEQGRVDVGGSFVASTQNITDSQFLAGGDLSLAGSSEASLINYGRIGALGGDVALIAAKVENRGTIDAAKGAVGLLAGYQVLLRDKAAADGKFSVVVGGASTSVTQFGDLRAAEAELRAQGGNIFALAGNTSGIVDARGIENRGGRIYLTAGDGEVRVAGTLTAQKADGSGGVIEVTGHNILLDDGARLVASGTDGGTVLVGGDWQGGNSPDLRLSDHSLRNANAVVMATDAIVDVSGSTGSGGNAVLWSDNYTNFHGTIDARGAGDGGRVETSSRNNLQAFGTVEATGLSGRAGSWLLDPTDITISTSTAGGSYSGGSFTPSANSANVSALAINATLNSGTDVTISAASGYSAPNGGTITVNSAITKTGGSTSTLTLSAITDIFVLAPISSSSGALNVVLNPRAAASNDSLSSTALGRIYIDASITTLGGNVTIGGGSGAAYSALSNSRGVELNTGNSIDAGGGNIIIRGITKNSDSGILLEGTVKTSGSGSIEIVGQNNTSGGNNPQGVALYTSSLVQTAAGAINITGVHSGNNTGTSDAFGAVTMWGGSRVNSTTGNISINGSANGNMAAFVSSTLAEISSTSGNITMALTGGAGDGLRDRNEQLTIQTGGAGGVSITTAVSSNPSSYSSIFIENGSTSIRGGSGGVTINGTSASAMRISGSVTTLNGGNISVSNGTLAASGQGATLGTVNSSGNLFVDLKNTGASIFVNTPVAASGPMTIMAGGSISMPTGTTLTANGNLKLTAGTSLSAGAVSVTAAASGAEISAGNAHTLSLGAISLANSGSSSISGGALSLGAITLSGNTDLLLDSIISNYTPTSITKTAAATGESMLTIRAYGDLDIDNGISAASGAGPLNVVLNPGKVGQGNIEIRSAITTRGGDLTIYGGNNDRGAGNGSTADGARLLSTTINTTGTAKNGNISIWGQTTNSANSGLYIYHSTLTTGGTGTVTLKGSGGSSGTTANGITIDGLQINAGSGDVTITGDGRGFGVQSAGGSAFNVTTTGKLKISGSSVYSQGFSRQSNQNDVFSAADIEIIGTANATSGGIGILFDNAGSLKLNGSNSVKLVGAGGQSAGGTNSAKAAIAFGSGSYNSDIDITAGAGGVIIDATGAATGADRSIDQYGTNSSITSTGTITITGNKEARFRAPITQNTSTTAGISIASNGVTTAAVTAAGSVLIDSGSSTFSSNGASGYSQVSGKTVSISGAGLYTGTISAVDALALASTADITVGSGGYVKSGSSGNVAITATGAMSLGTVDFSGDDVSVVAGGAITIPIAAYFRNNGSTLVRSTAGAITLPATYFTGNTTALVRSDSASISSGQVNITGSTPNITYRSSSTMSSPVVQRTGTGIANFTLGSDQSVSVSSAITASSGLLNVTLHGDMDSTAAGPTSGSVTIAAAINTNGGNLLVRGGSAALSAVADPATNPSSYLATLLATGIYGAIDAANINVGSGDIEIRTLGSGTGNGFNHTGALTTSGNLRVYGLGGASGGYGLNITGGASIRATGSGTATVYGMSRAGLGGILVTGSGSAITSAGGSLVVSGTSVANTSSNGINVTSGGTIGMLGGSGAALIHGVGSTSGGGMGISISGAGAITSAGSGALLVSGTGGGGSAAGNYGIGIISGTSVPAISSTGGGNIELSGIGGGGSGGQNYGVSIQSTSANSGVVRASGAATIGIVGTGGSGAATTNYGLFLDGPQTTSFATSGSGSIQLSGTAGPGATYGIYQGVSGAATVGSASMSGPITFNANSMFLNGAGGALLPQTSGIVTFAPVNTGSLSIAGDILASIISSNTMRYGYGGVQLGSNTASAVTLTVPFGQSDFTAPLIFASNGTFTVANGGGGIPLTATNGISFAGAATVTQTVDIVANSISGAAANLVLTRAGNAIAALGPMNVSGNLGLNTSAGLTIQGAILVGTAGIRSAGDLTLASGATVTATGTDTVGALQLATGTKIINSAGAGVLSAPSSRWLLWSQDPAFDSLGGLAGDFYQYSAYYGVTNPLGSGNGLMYTKAPQLTITLTGNTSKVYDGTDIATLAQGNYVVTGLLNGDLATIYGAATFDTKDIGTGKTVTVDDMAAVVKNGTTRVYGYVLATGSTSATMGSITARSLTASLTGDITKVYDGTTAATLSAANYLLANAAIGDDVYIVASSPASYDNKNAGTGHVVTINGLTLGGADAGNYTVNSTATAGFGVITPKALSASLTGTTSKVYDGNILAGTVDASNVNLTGIVAGDTVSLGSGLVGLYADKNVGTGKTVNVFGLSLTGASASNYTVASTASGSIGTITRKQITASLAGPITKVYDGTATAGLSPASIAGIVSGDAVTVSSSGASYDNKNAGTNKLVTVTGLNLGGADAGNYDLLSTSASANVGVITARSVTVDITGRGAKTYDGTTSLSAAQYGSIGFSLAQGDSATQTLLASDGVGLNTAGISAALVDRNAGSGKSMLVTGFALNNNALGNYVLTSTTVYGLADVARANLTMTASSDSKVYDGTIASAGLVSVAGLFAGDIATGTQTFDARNAGTRTLDVTSYTVNDGNGGNNYIVTTQTAVGQISQRSISTTVIADDKVYDGTTAATGTFSSLGNLVAGDTVSVTGALEFADKHVGTAKTVTVSGATLTGADAANYLLDPIAAGAADISRASLTLSATSDTRVYDGTTLSGVAVTATGLAAGDTVNATQSFDARTAGARLLQVDAGWSVDDGNGGNNYTVTLAGPTAGTITQKELTATAAVSDKVYDGTTTASGTLSALTGVIGSDDVALDTTGGTVAFYDRNAGTNKTVAVTGFGLTGADALNYSLSAIANSSATISRAALTLAAVTDSRQYDGTTASSGAVEATGLITGDGFSASQVFDGKNAGNHTLQVASYSIFDGNGGNNYVVTLGTVASGTITQRVVQASATVNDKIYDGTVFATGSFSGLSNTIAGDDVSLDSSGATLAFYDRNAGAGKTVTVAGVSLTGTDAFNYTLSDIANGTANINKASLLLTASDDSKIYDGTRDSTGMVSASGLVSGDTVVSAQAFDTKNAGSRTLQVDSWTISDGNGGNNYAVVLDTAANGSIAQKVLDGTLSGTVTKVYDGTTTAVLLPVNLTGVIAGDDLTLNSGSANYADENAGTGKTVTVSGMALSGLDASNYVLSATNASADIGTITAREVAVTVSGRGAKVYDGTTVLTNAQFGTFAFTLADGDSVTQLLLADDGVALDNNGVSAVLDDRNAGIGKGVTLSGFALTGNGLGNFTLAGSGSTLALADVTRASLTLDAVTDSKTYDGTRTSTGTVTISGLIAGDTATAEQSFDTKNAGSRSLQVTGWVIDDGNGGNNYTVVTHDAAGTIAQKQINAALTGTVSKIYDGTTTAALLGANLLGIVAGDDIIVNTTSADYADKNAGTGKLVTVSGITLSGTDAANYDLLSDSASDYVGEITARQVAISATGAGAKTYDGTTVISGSQLGGITFAMADGDAVTQTLLATDGIILDTGGLSGLLADRNAGTGKSVMLSGYALANNALGNYVLASPTTLGLVHVAQAALTLIAADDSKTYDGNTSSSGIVTASGLVTGDSFTASQVFDSRNAGARLLKVNGGFTVDDGNGGANYSVSFVDGNGTIAQRRVSTTVNASDKVYDGTTTATGSFAPLDNLVAGDSVGVAGTLAFTDRNAGLGKTVTVSGATLTGADAANYQLDPVADGFASISRAGLTLTAAADSKVYDGTTASGAAVIASGLVGGDTLTASQAFDSRNAGVRALQVENGWVISDGNGGNNYIVTIGAATAGTITPKSITATATVEDKTYDGTTTATGTFAGLIGVVGSDAVALDGTNGSLSFFDRNAGSGKVVVANGYVLSGLDAANYLLDPIANGTATIFQKALTVNAVASDKVYDGTIASAANIEAVGLVTGDNVVGTQAYDDRNAGLRTLSVQSYTVYDGNGGNNYAVSIGSTATGNIERKEINASVVADNKTYDGTVYATGTFSGLAGVIGGDTVTLDSTTGTLAFIDRNAGAGKSVVVSGLSLGGADAGNYVLSDIANGTADILKAALTLTASSDSKTYDGTRASTGLVSIAGLVGGDTATATQAFDSKNAGSRTLVVEEWTIDDGNNGNNYSVTRIDNTGSIGQLLLSGDISGTVSKVYDRTDQVTLLPVNLTGVVAGDSLTLTTTSATYSGANVGTGKTVTVSGMVLTGIDASNYVLQRDFATADIGEITPRQIAVSVNGLGSKTYDGTQVLGSGQLGTLVLTAAAGDSVTQAMLAADGVLLDSAAVTGLLADRNAGTGKSVTLSGYQLTNNSLGNYALVSPELLAVADVARAALTLTAVSDSKVYDGTTASGGEVLIAGLVGGDAISATQAFDSRNAGNRTLQVSDGYALDDGNGGQNYMVSKGAAATGTIDRRQITATAHAEDKIYDGTTIASGSFDPLSNVISGDDVRITGASFGFAVRNVGTGNVSVTGASLAGADAGNYLLDPILDTSATISKAHLVLTASNDSKTYDGTTNSSGLVTAIGLQAGDNFTAEQAFDSRNAGDRSLIVGSYTVSDGNGGGNYEVSLVDAAGTIVRRLVSSGLTANDKVYDGTTAATGTFGALANVISGDSVALDTTSGALSFADRNAGLAKVVKATGFSLTGSDALNYVLADIAADVADIGKANLLLSAGSDSKIYDGTSASSAAVLAIGLVAGDLLSATQAFDSKNAGSRTLQVTGWVIGDGAGGNNYSVALAAPTAGTITPRHLTATASADNKVYDGTTVATGSLSALSNVVAGDSVNANGRFAFVDKNAGAGKAVMVADPALSGDDAANYVLDPIAAAIATITPKALTANFAGPVSKSYDGTTAIAFDAGAIGLTGLLTGDSVTVTGSGRFADRNAGTDKLVVADGLSLYGTDAANYAVEAGLSANVGTITPALLAISARSDSKTYNGSDHSSLTPLVSGLKQGDAIAGLSQSFDSANAGARTLSVGQFSIDDGNEGANYLIEVSDADGTIRARSLTLALTDLFKLVGSQDPTFTYSLGGEGLVSGDQLSGNASRAAGEAVGAYAITAGSLSAGANYSLQITPGTLTILAAGGGSGSGGNPVVPSVDEAPAASQDAAPVTSGTATRNENNSGGTTNGIGFDSSGSGFGSGGAGLLPGGTPSWMPIVAGPRWVISAAGTVTILDGDEGDENADERDGPSSVDDTAAEELLIRCRADGGAEDICLQLRNVRLPYPTNRVITPNLRFSLHR